MIFNIFTADAFGVLLSVEPERIPEIPIVEDFEEGLTFEFGRTLILLLRLSELVDVCLFNWLKLAFVIFC